jgi:kinesin family protein C1
LFDLSEELKRYREKTQTLERENRGLRKHLREVQEQATTLGTEQSTLEGELANVRTRAEQDQQRLEMLSACVLELEEYLGTTERLVQELQRERLQLKEEWSTLSIQLEEQERRFQVAEAALSSSQEEVVCLWQKTEAQVTLLAKQGDQLYGLEMERDDSTTSCRN